ncbi:hypothetical protein VUR80DRAFT_6150 [Thermomyces stellatus]
MSKVPFNPKTAVHALRGLALGTSCSLILVSEERRRRIDLARTLVDNGRLIKAQRCSSTAGAAVQVESVAEAPIREPDVPSKPDLSWIYGEPSERKSARPTLIPERVHHPAFPTIRKESATRTTSIATGKSARLNAEPVLEDEQGQAQETAPTAPSSVSEDAHLLAFEKDFEEVKSLQKFPPEFLESTISIIRELEQQDNVQVAQMILDRLCHHRATDFQTFNGIGTEFLLRCLLAGRGHTGMSALSGRRFKLAVFLFWKRRKLLATPEETDALIELVARLFAADDVEPEIQSFLATSHVHFGRHMTTKLIVVPIAKLYRARGGKNPTLDRWLRLADKAGVPMRATTTGSVLMRWWEAEDALQGTAAPADPCVRTLRRDLRYPLSFELKRLNQEQRDLFDRMNEGTKTGDWKGVLDCYSEGLGAGVEASAACLRLAVEAAVGLEGIHTPRALKLIEEAHKASVDVKPVVQTLLKSRFVAIGDLQKENYTPETRGNAYKAMQGLLDAVRDYYDQPSEILYNADIRVCLRVAEVTQARDLCLKVAEELWGGDVAHTPRGFANLLQIAVRTKDWKLLQRMLEAIPWKEYRVQPICKLALKDARSALRAMVRDARTPEASAMYEMALGSVEIALQNVMEARAANHMRVKNQVRLKALGPFGSMRENGRAREARARTKAAERPWGQDSSPADEALLSRPTKAESEEKPALSPAGLVGRLGAMLQRGEQACRRMLGF